MMAIVTRYDDQRNTLCLQTTLQALKILYKKKPSSDLAEGLLSDRAKTTSQELSYYP